MTEMTGKELNQHKFKEEGMNIMDNTQTKPDCFGYKLGKCTVLKKMVCKYKECPFYKTNEQYAADKEKYRVSMS